ncbi:DUF2380 domain-containing protein [Paracoccus cavernae]|uniref:DUF2380 domain-containing protein n=1 Tax=Paracoccus cavernae TaxID=1571207 RepID=A0ABT8D4B1_9RHOB|nr:DUF2380 domain-containing protein [Paracoccus cavernae]
MPTRNVPLLAALALALFPVAAKAESLALMPVKFFDTSHEAKDQREDHQRRVDLMSAELARVLAPEVSRVSSLTPRDVATACTPETVPCLITLAKGTGSDLALFVVVHKSSTLIMQIFVQLVDLDAETTRFDRNLSFRGDTDESWIKAAGFLGRSLEDELEP